MIDSGDEVLSPDSKALYVYPASKEDLMRVILDAVGLKENPLIGYVRGSVMNPNDHPHGGGEGKTGIGRPGPCTPWGKPALGLKTRKKNKASNKMIVRRRDGKAIK